MAVSAGGFIEPVSRKRALALFLGFSMAAGMMRWPAITQGLWEDEATSVFIARAPGVAEFLHRQAAIDYSPPLFNALLAGWGRIFGFGEIPVKGFAIGLGSLACGAIALAAGEMFGAGAGAFAGALALVHGLLVEMTSEARPYSLSVLTVALCLWALFRFVHRGRPTRSSLVLFGVTALLAAGSHYAGTVVVITIGLFALVLSLRPEHRRVWLPVAGMTFLVGLVLLPWAPFVWRQIHVGLPWAVRSYDSWGGRVLYKAFALLPGGVPGSPLPVAGAAIVTAALVSSHRAAAAEIRNTLPGLVLVAVAALSAFFAVGLHGQVERYVIVPAALATILCGALLRTALVSATREGRVEAAAAAVGAALIVLYAGELGFRESRSLLSAWRHGASRSFVRVLVREGRFRRGDLVIAAPDMLGPTLWYYLPPGVVLRGFMHWRAPAFADFSDYDETWTNPKMVDRIAGDLEDDVSALQVSRIVLVWAVSNDNPLPFRTRTRELRAAISSEHPLVSSEILGAGERIQIDVWEPSGTTRRADGGQPGAE